MSDEEVSRLGVEEQRFASLVLSGVDLEAAARTSGIVDAGASSSLAKRTAQQALGDSEIKAFMIEVFEQADLTPLDLAKTIKRNQTTRKYGINQKTGEVVDLGDDGMTQVSAAKLGLQVIGALGGGVKPVEQSNVPAAIQVNFNVRNVREPREKEGTVIDGDDDYRVS